MTMFDLDPTVEEAVRADERAKVSEALRRAAATTERELAGKPAGWLPPEGIALLVGGAQAARRYADPARRGHPQWRHQRRDGTAMTVDNTLLPRQRACDDPAGSWELVRRAQAGDSDAFADIYARYHEFVLTFVLGRVGRHRAVAEDITSDVFLTAIRRINSFTRPERDLGAWLATIARNKVIDSRKCGPRRFEIPSGWTDVWEGAGARHAPDTASLVLTRDRDRALWRAVRDLDSQPQRRVIALRFLRGLSIERTAAVMGLSVGAVKALQYRATRALRRALAPLEVAG